MYKYAVVEEFGSVIDIITVSDMNTLDGYNLPEGPCTLVILNGEMHGWGANKDEPTIGAKYNFLEDKFE